jgi:hypothetical protein
MSLISTTRHHHALWLRLRHSVTRSGGTSSLRLARLASDLNNGIAQHTPSPDPYSAWNAPSGGGKPWADRNENLGRCRNSAKT